MTGIILYLLSGILQSVNDCQREHSVRGALLYKHHVTGHANSELETEVGDVSRAAVNE